MAVPNILLYFILQVGGAMKSPTGHLLSVQCLDEGEQKMRLRRIYFVIRVIQETVEGVRRGLDH